MVSRNGGIDELTMLVTAPQCLPDVENEIRNHILLPRAKSANSLPYTPGRLLARMEKRREKRKEKMLVFRINQAFSKVITPRFLASSRVTLTSAA